MDAVQRRTVIGKRFEPWPLSHASRDSSLKEGAGLEFISSLNLPSPAQTIPRDGQRQTLRPSGILGSAGVSPAPEMGVLAMKLIDRLALTLAIIGGLNWGCVGIFGLDLVAALFGGSARGLSRLVYILVFLSALWCVTMFFREDAGERTVSRPA